MSLKIKKGFTLAELLISVMLFGFMASSLATLYATANRHVFQSYREHRIKNNVSLAYKFLFRSVTAATRIDSPGVGASSNVLAAAENVDSVTGCYPIASAATSTWHYFCLSGTLLYYHTGTLAAAGAPQCPPTFAPPVITYPAFCGPGGGGTVVLLADNINTAVNLFSRRAADGVNERNSVLVRLRSRWDASGYGASRAVDYSITSKLVANNSCQ